MSEVGVSFVIPCLNEEKTLASAINLCKEAISKLAMPCEIVIADNGSTDRSIQIAEEEGARVVAVKNKGYGNALIEGIRQSKGKYVVMGDADATYDFRESVEFIKVLAADKADMVIGSRLKGNIEPGAMPFLHRYLGTPVLSFLIRQFFNLPISDCNCGMRAFTKEAFNKMSLISGGMEFASEMLIKAGVLGLRVKEINCSLAVDKRDRAPHLKTWRDGWRHLKFILAFAPKYVFYYPGILIMLLGILLTSMVSFGRITIANIPFDYNFMYVGALFIFIGYQLIWLSRFERYYVQFVGYLSHKNSQTFNFDSYARLAGIFVLLGVIITGTAISNWVGHLFFASGLNIRLLILGIDGLMLGSMTFINALMISMMQIKNTRLN